MIYRDFRAELDEALMFWQSCYQTVLDATQGDSAKANAAAEQAMRDREDAKAVAYTLVKKEI